MAMPRSETVNPMEQGIYHCWSRCVRRAFLCGFDSLTGKNFDHRKQWVVDRMKYLVNIFAIDVLAYAVMDNHQHVVIRNNPEISGKWSDEEVAKRWLELFPKRRKKGGVIQAATKEDILSIVTNPEKVAELRTRLSDISWFMRCLKENIARRANAEEDVTGHFWESRFKSTRLDNAAAVVSGMVYVDLNPIRAGKAKCSEESLFTSAYERLCSDLNTSKNQKLEDIIGNKITESVVEESWLCPIESIFHTKSGLTLEEYLEVVDLTGRRIVEGKRGSIPESLAPILERMSINTDNWLKTSTDFTNLFPRVSGSVNNMKEAARCAGRKWFRGLSAAKICF